MASNPEIILVLSVDRDGDLERKTGIRSPIFGKEAVLAAATALAVSDPEEADANALFAAVREYDRLRAQGIQCEVGAVCGVEEGHYSADRKIRREAESLLSRQQFTGIVLISDGAEDELVIPILQTLKPILSVRRIVVKHSRSVEENYMVLGRYLRMLVFDPRYSRWAIGIPGIIFLFAGILFLRNAGYLATLSILIIVGAALLVRGFNIDRFVAGMLSQKPYGFIRLFTIPTSLLIFFVGLSSGYSNMVVKAADLMAAVSASPPKLFQYGSALVGYYLQGAILLIWTAMGIYLAGTLLTQVLRGSARSWRSGTEIVVLALLFLPVSEFGDFLVNGGTSTSGLLITYVLIGMAAIFAVVGTLYPRLRSRPTPPNTIAPAPGMQMGETSVHQDDRDAPEEHQD